MNTLEQQSPLIGIQEAKKSAGMISTRTVVIIAFLLQIVVSLLLRYFSYIGDTDPETIEQVLTYFTADDIRNGAAYHRAGFSSGLIARLMSIALTIVFVFTPASRKIEDFLSSRSKNSFVLLCLYFIAIHFFINTVVFLPFSYYFGFVLEHQFGFSRMTSSEWALLQCKQIALNFCIWVPLKIGALLVLKYFARSWFYIVPIASFVLAILWTAVWPIVVTPLFYDYAPLADGPLKEKIIALTHKAHIDVENIYTINESRYSNHTNAYFVGWGGHRKIFLYDTLIAKHTDDEVISVLGHEIGHWQRNHVVKKVLLSSVLLFLGCILVLGVFHAVTREGKMPLQFLYAPSTLPFIFFLASLISLVTDPLESAYSRACESEADSIALSLTDDSNAFIEAHKKMVRDNRIRLDPHPISTLWFSHPTTLQRIAMAEEYRARSAGK